MLPQPPGYSALTESPLTSGAGHSVPETVGARKQSSSAESPIRPNDNTGKSTRFTVIASVSLAIVRVMARPSVSRAMSTVAVKPVASPWPVQIRRARVWRSAGSSGLAASHEKKASMLFQRLSRPSESSTARAHSGVASSVRNSRRPVRLNRLGKTRPSAGFNAMAPSAPS